ncbi:MAG: NAD-dependent epimerase/dehydratase family protein [Polyangiales bacterium]
MSDAQAPTGGQTDGDLGVCLVTGGAGFLAGHIARALLEQGHTVRSLDLRQPTIWHARFSHQRGDLRVPADVRRACDGVDTVFHTAAVVDFVGVARRARRARSFDLNVVGTQHVIDACLDAGVARLVYTSSNNVVLGTPVTHADSRTPYPTRYADLYSTTKAQAERLVLAANGRAHRQSRSSTTAERVGAGVLSTCALRPGGIYGVGDPFYLPQVIEKCARGLLLADIGDGRAMADNTFVGNLVHGELLAARHLSPESPVAGRAYYITDGEPTNPLEFFRPIIEGLGYRVPTRRLPYRPMYALGYAWELLHRLHLAPEPQVTRLHCMKAAVSHSGSLDEARRDFGYEPVHAWRDELAACVPYCREVLEEMRAGRWPR